MKAEHLKAFIWLRWRIRINQISKGGVANTVLLAVLAVMGAMVSCGLAIGLFLVGFLALAMLTPTILFVWDGMVVGCLFLWLTGLITELQRSESLSLTKFLHLPVSATGVFLINYLSSFISINLLIFGPAMLALALGLVLSRGPVMLLQLPLVAAFFFMMTALTYQFQGWLAALMVNPRRRRTIVVFLTMGFILLAQLPNLANLIGGPCRRKFDPASSMNGKLAESAHHCKKSLRKNGSFVSGSSKRARSGSEAQRNRLGTSRRNSSPRESRFALRLAAPGRARTGRGRSLAGLAGHPGTGGDWGR